MKIKLKLAFSIFFSMLLATGGFAQEAKKKDNQKALVTKNGDTIPARFGKINDFEKLFTAAETEELQQLVNNFELESGIEIDVLTVDTSQVSSDKLESFVVAFGNKWSTEKKDGKKRIVIGFSRGHRKIRIANNDEIAELITDKETKTIIEKEIIPHFKKDGYYKGTIAGLKAMIGLLKDKN